MDQRRRPPSAVPRASVSCFLFMLASLFVLHAQAPVPFIIPPPILSLLTSIHLCGECLCRYGWGNWDKIRACILASPRFIFDYYLRSLSESALAKHCEQLMKSAEKYLQVGFWETQVVLGGGGSLCTPLICHRQISPWLYLGIARLREPDWIPCYEVVLIGWPSSID